jgi:hypothetical protein
MPRYHVTFVRRSVTREVWLIEAPPGEELLPDVLAVRPHWPPPQPLRTEELEEQVEIEAVTPLDQQEAGRS